MEQNPAVEALLLQLPKDHTDSGQSKFFDSTYSSYMADRQSSSKKQPKFTFANAPKQNDSEIHYTTKVKKFLTNDYSSIQNTKRAHQIYSINNSPYYQLSKKKQASKSPEDNNRSISRSSRKSNQLISLDENLNQFIAQEQPKLGFGTLTAKNNNNETSKVNRKNIEMKIKQIHGKIPKYLIQQQQNISELKTFSLYQTIQDVQQQGVNNRGKSVSQVIDKSIIYMPTNLRISGQNVDGSNNDLHGSIDMNIIENWKIKSTKNQGSRRKSPLELQNNINFNQVILPKLDHIQPAIKTKNRYQENLSRDTQFRSNVGSQSMQRNSGEINQSRIANINQSVCQNNNNFQQRGMSNLKTYLKKLQIKDSSQYDFLKTKINFVQKECYTQKNYQNVSQVNTRRSHMEINDFKF